MCVSIQVPPISSATAIKSELISFGSSTPLCQAHSSGRTSGFEPYYSSSRPISTSSLSSPSSSSANATVAVFSPNHSKAIPAKLITTEFVPALSPSTVQYSSPNTIHSIHDITSGCSRTIPISWSSSGSSASVLQV